MSKYTTGEIAERCGITVRTVQYYDQRGLLVPSELTEGGRRIYSEDDLRHMKLICFLRDLGLPIESVRQLLAEEDPGSVISLLLDQQENTLKKEVGERNEKLEKLKELRNDLKNCKDLSLDSIGDIAYNMSNKNGLKKMHRYMLITGIPLGIYQVTSIVLWIVKGWWWLFLIWAVIAVPYGIIWSRIYYKKVAYICPQCHKEFKPSFKEMFFANHTPNTRKLTCPSCGHKGFCVETDSGNEGTET